MNKFWISIILLLLFRPLLSERYAHFDHYTTEDGMISNRITSITQDSLGYIWMATDFGLERFDGKRFKHYQKKEYPKLIRNDFHGVKYVHNNKIMICGYNGMLMEYDIEKDEFYDIKPKDFEENYYKEIGGIYKNEKWEYLMTGSGIYIYDKEKEEYNTNFAAYDSIQSVVRAMHIDEYDRFWIGTTYNNVSVYEKSGKKIKEFSKKGQGMAFVTGMRELKNKKLIVTLLSNELWIFDNKDKELNEPSVIYLPFSNICQLIEDRDNNIWFGTDGDGLWRTTFEGLKSGKFEKIIPLNAEAERMDKIYAMLEDRRGNIWVGTQNGGIWRLKNSTNNEMIFSSDCGFPSFPCTSFTEDDKGKIWVATDGNGVFAVDEQCKIIKHYKFANNNILGICYDKNEIVVATWGGGIFKINPETGTTREEIFDGIEQPVNCYFNIHKDDQGNYFACSAGDGLYVRHHNGKWHIPELKDDSLSAYPNKWIFNVIDGKNDTKWVVTTNTLWKLNKNEIKAMLPDFSASKSHRPLSIEDGICDKEGNLFIATNYGIYRFPAEGGAPDTLNFIPNSIYRIIRFDNNGTIWAASIDGIISIDYENKKYQKVHLDIKDISKYYFFCRSGYKDSKGNIYFGTNSGFFKFKPENIFKESEIDNFDFSELYINQKKIKPYDKSVLEKGNLRNHSKIELNYDETDIKIGINLLDLSQSEKIQCRYKIIGFNNKWVDMNGKREITINYMPTGKYQLVVETFRTNPEKSKQISLEIIVLPPWWESWYFYTIMAFLAIALISLFFYFRFRHLLRKKRELEYVVEERTWELKEALGEKNRLLSVIAHDLKNPMFAIVGALNTWLQKEKNDDRQTIEKVHESAVALQSEMIKLLNWARSDVKEIAFKPQNTNLELCTNNIIQLILSLVNEKNLNLKLQFSLRNYAYVDARMIETVLRNLLVNAIKFTPEGGDIEVIGEQNKDSILLTIKDSGVGMTSNQIQSILNGEKNLSTMGTRKEKGYGIGINLCREYLLKNNCKMEIESKRDVGTTIIISLPISEEELMFETNETRNNLTLPVDIQLDASIFDGNVILVVDDDILIRENISYMISQYTTVITASNGKEAIEMAQKNMPDIIISDIEMPEMDGIEMCSILHKDPQFNHIPILFVSACTEESRRLSGYLHGAIDYITKPFNKKELLIKLSNILSVRQEQQRRYIEQFQANQIKDEAVIEEVNPFVAHFMEVLEECYTESQVSVELLAQKMNVSQSTLNRKLRTLTSQSPIILLTEYRLKKAKEILQKPNNDYSISDICYMVGFNDPSYFTRKYKEYFGHTPSQKER